jgi:hypothetical protein
MILGYNKATNARMYFNIFIRVSAAIEYAGINVVSFSSGIILRLFNLSAIRRFIALLPALHVRGYEARRLEAINSLP